MTERLSLVVNVFFLAVMAFSVPFSVQAQCTNTVFATTPASRFVITDDIVVDTKTNLAWMRCSLGQSLAADSTCSGSVLTFTWAEALQAAEQFNQDGGLGGFTDWRLPNRNELASIVERRCYSPSINETIFPDTPGDEGYWTSSPEGDSMAWLVRFNVGPVYTSQKVTGWAVRLVRDAER